MYSRHNDITRHNDNNDNIYIYICIYYTHNIVISQVGGVQDDEGADDHVEPGLILFLYSLCVCMFDCLIALFAYCCSWYLMLLCVEPGLVLARAAFVGTSY